MIIVMVAIAAAIALIYFSPDIDQQVQVQRDPPLNAQQSPVPTDRADISGRSSLSGDALKVGSINQNKSEAALSFPQLFDFSEQSVVQLKNTNEQGDLFSNRLGSGFVYDDNGHIITNHHVVSGEREMDVTFLDGTIYRAVVIGSDPYTDLAVLYVDAPEGKLHSLPLGESTTLQVGQQVAAIGNPYGLSGSMTSGIISGLGRQIPSQEQNRGLVYSIPDVIQTDAPINPGNSGGPLLNMYGEVIGVNSAIFSTTGEFSGVGFAVPSDTIKKVAPSLITLGSFRHPWIGVSGMDMTPGIADALGLQEPRGFLVIDVVPGSPADNAGIVGGTISTEIDGRPLELGGDLIMEIDNKTVRKIDDILIYLQREKEVEDTITITLLRDNEVITKEAVLGARPTSQETP